MNQNRKRRGIQATNRGIEIIENSRIGKNWTRQTLADRASVSLDTLERLINGVRNGVRVDKESIIRVTQVLDLQLTDIVDPNEWNPVPSPPEPVVPGTEPEFPGEPMPLDSAFYLERYCIESDCYKEITKHGALIRIQGPMKRGKTSLLNKILQNAARRDYRTVSLNIELADFTNLNIFLRRFCANVSRKLGVSPRLDDWDQEQELFGSMESCTTYFQTQLLESLDSPLVLGLDNVDRVFEYPDIAREFLALLRDWHEEAKKLDVWQRLRLAIAHSTEVYIRLDVNQSPFNVGLPVKLPNFTRAQVQDLARHYGLVLGDEETRRLMAMVGGHPYLIQLGFYHLWHQDVPLDQLLHEAPTQAGIYSTHLRHLLGLLQKHSELAAAMKRVVTADTSVPLEPIQAYKLESMGLVQLDGNECTPSCKLYRQYFRSHL